ncbi:hypothetical protein QNH98_01920 [Myroides sp. mNGS23_01]|nr:hypothetical protein [Myroides sp. mNGS23_01]WHT39485.1 hypothetical protein QNH98_01920 [Myroides sp. mNGS23_01]
MQNRIFENFINEHVTDNKFQKDELTSFIYKSSSKRNRLDEQYHITDNSLMITRLFGSEIITMEIAQSIAELIISRGDKNKVIEKLPFNTLSDTYEFKGYGTFP